MVNTVLVFVYRVGINEVLHVHILAWVVVSCLLHNPIEVIFQHIVCPPRLWQLFICLLALTWGARHVVYLNISHLNHIQPWWKVWGSYCVSMVPGCCLRYGIHKVPVVGLRHHVWFILPVGVHTCTWLFKWRYICYTPCPWDCMQLWIPMES